MPLWFSPRLFIPLPFPREVKLLSSQAARSKCLPSVICLPLLYSVHVRVCVNVQERQQGRVPLQAPHAQQN